MKFPSLLLPLLLAHTLSAGVTDVRPLTGAASLDSYTRMRPGVVATGNGWFLANGIRVSPGGERADSEVIPGSDDSFVVPWEEGWLLVAAETPELIRIRRLGISGPSELVAEFAKNRHSGLREVIAAHGHLVLVETMGADVWLTHRTLDRVVRTQLFENMTEPAIVPMNDGFLLLGRDTGINRRTTGRFVKLDRDGAPVATSAIDVRRGLGSVSNTLHTNGEAALWISGSFDHFGLEVIDSSLNRTPTVFLPRTPGRDTRISSVLPIDGGFFVSYGSSQELEWRAAGVSNGGERLFDVNADPIIAGDEVDGRYLVVRPWLDAAIAEDDPRTIVTPAIRLPARAPHAHSPVRTAVSNGVTLALLDGNSPPVSFVRVERGGEPIDPEPVAVRDAPSNTHIRVVPIPDGFAFLWLWGDHILMQRLSLRGGWIDSMPREIGIAEGIRPPSFAADAGESDILIGWATGDELRWMRVAFDGALIDTVARSEPIPDFPDRKYGGWPNIEIASGNGFGDRLLVVRYEYYCVILCTELPEHPVHVLTVSAAGTALGHVQAFGRDAYSRGGVALPDGTWALPVSSVGLLQLDRTGAELRRSPLQGAVGYLSRTPAGWRSILGGEVREFTGFDELSSVTWADAQRRDSFFPGYGDLVIFRSFDVLLRGHRVYSGMLSGEPGDLSIEIGRAWLNGHERIAETFVTNHGTRAVSAFVAFSPGFNGVAIDGIEPGETRRVVVRGSASLQDTLTIEVRSEAIIDTSPENNSDLLTPQELIPMPRRGAVKNGE